MKYITYQQYRKYLENKKAIVLKEEETIYQTVEDKTYSKEIVKEIDKRHDKMFLNVLSRKKEMIKFLNDFLDLKEKIEETQIIQCPTDFITRFYKSRQSDILYRLNDKPVYFLIEHQSTIHPEMLLRIWEYIGEIVRKETIRENTYFKGNSIYPIVIPIIIYTGFQKWNLPTNFDQKQYQSKSYQDYAISLSYNLITVHDYTFEELFKKRTLFSSIMIIEKCKDEHEINNQMNKIIEIIQEPKDKEALSEIIVNIIRPIVGTEKAEIMLEKINKKEVQDMSPFTKFLLDYKYQVLKESEKAKKESEKLGMERGIEKGIEKGMKKGIKQGMKQGIKKAIQETVKNMIQFGEPDEKIMKYIGINKEELENIKGMLIQQ